MKKYFSIPAIAVIIAGCASLGTKTLYSAGNKVEIKKLGFSNLDGASFVNRIFPKTDSIFRSAFINTTGKFNLTPPIYLENELSIEKPDTALIMSMCKEKNLDGLIVSRLKFINTSYSVYLIPVGQSFDTEVEMKLFSSAGGLLFSVRYGTLKGNSYLNFPTGEKTVRDGAVGAINKIAKEFGWKK